MSTRLTYDRLNANSAFPDKIEGYWRAHQEPNLNHTSYDKKISKYPWPLPFEVEGYDKDEFIKRLMEKQEDAKQVVYRGVSLHRLTNKANGNSEFELDGWKWPSGYISYLTMGVPPSRAFYKVITGEDLSALPTYGRPDA